MSEWHDLKAASAWLVNHLGEVSDRPTERTTSALTAAGKAAGLSPQTLNLALKDLRRSGRIQKTALQRVPRTPPMSVWHLP